MAQRKAHTCKKRPASYDKRHIRCEGKARYCVRCSEQTGGKRKTLCVKCRSETAVASGHRGGKAAAKKTRQSFYAPPSRQAGNRRIARRNAVQTVHEAESMGVNMGSIPDPPLAAGLDVNSIPKAAMEARLDVVAYADFLEHWDRCGYQKKQVRFLSDYWDMQVVSRWALKTREQYGLPSALLGLVVAAHFNSVRTFGMVQGALLETVDWPKFRVGLQRAGELWGHPHAKKPTWAVYSSDCMSGSGLPAVDGHYLDRFPMHFERVLSSTAFQGMLQVVDGGVRDADQADKLRAQAMALRKVVSGLLGEYHFKMLMDLLVATGWYPARLVRHYPVCRNSGTAQGLQLLFNNSSRLSMHLDLLTEAVRTNSRSWTKSDHCGTVGAQLCWLKRQRTPASKTACANRFDQTSYCSWETQLQQLSEAGVNSFWL